MSCYTLTIIPSCAKLVRKSWLDFQKDRTLWLKKPSTNFAPRPASRSRITTRRTKSRWTTPPTWASRANIRLHAESTRRCIAGGSGRCASTPATPAPRNPMPATVSCSNRGRAASRSPSTCPPRSATTPTTRWRWAKSARSASASAACATWSACLRRSRWIKSRPA